VSHTLTAEQHRAMEGEAPFHLPEEAVVSGRKMAGTRARVYWLLRLTAERAISHRIGEQFGPPGWVPNYYFTHAWSGGSAGDRRRRDLSEKFGVEIESCRFGGDSAVVLFRWVMDPITAPEAARSPNASRAYAAESLPTALGGRMGGLRLRFWTSAGFPGDSAPNRLQLVGGFSDHPLTIAPQLLTQIVAGKFSAADALVMYNGSLQTRWPKLKAWLAGRGDWVLWLAPEAASTINPFPLLVEILGKCGAEYLGDWQAADHSNRGVA